jgi:predicted PurR-regulated permease PerM
VIRYFRKSKALLILVYSLLGLSILYLLILTKPMIYGMFIFLKAVMMPFLVALMISYILNPIVNLLSNRKVPRTIAVLLIYSIFILSVVIMLMNLIPLFVTQFGEMKEHLPDVNKKVQIFVDDINRKSWLPDSIRQGFNHSLEKLENWVSFSVSEYVNQIGSTINTLLVACIIPFLAFYILKDFQLLEKTALRVVPPTYRHQTVKLLIDVDTALGNYIRGQLIVCTIVGIMAYLGYWWIDMPYPLLLASLVAIFNIIPYLGPFFGAAPALLMASTISLNMVLCVVVVNVSIQVLEGNIISPQVVGKKLHLHPLVIIFALLVGGEMAGIVGLILAVPFFAVIKVIVQHVYMQYNNISKE